MVFAYLAKPIMPRTQDSSVAATETQGHAARVRLRRDYSLEGDLTQYVLMHATEAGTIESLRQPQQQGKQGTSREEYL